MPKRNLSIAVQPDLNTRFAEWGFYAELTGGEITAAVGLGGITQPEDSARILLQSPNLVHWREFLWSHYTLLRLDLLVSDEACLELRGAGRTHVLPVGLIGTSALRINLADNGALYVAEYNPAAGGKFGISPTAVVAGSTQTFTMEFRVGDSGIAEGGGIRVMTPYSSWSSPVLREDSIVLETTGRASLTSSLLRYAHPVFGSVYWIKVQDASLLSGDVVRVKYSGGEHGVKVQTYVKDRVPFPCFVDVRGDGLYYPTSYADGPAVGVVAGAPRRIRLAAPMICSPGEEIEVRTLVLDEHYNPVRDCSSKATLLELRKDGAEVSEAYTSHGSTSVRLPEPGWYLLTASGDGLCDSSLVVKCVEGGKRLYWGAIHGHTEVSDGEFDPDEYYRYGREVGLVDFCSIADHDWEIVEHERNRKRGGFRLLQEIAQEHNAPGRFVTFSCYEWMSREGHINVYYSNNLTDNPIFIGSVSILDRAEAATVAELIKIYNGRQDVMLIPHSSHGLVWNAHDPALMPVVEIYSCWGCSEYELGPIGPGANAGLRLGYRFGFIGGADSHHGSPGHTCRPSKYHVLPCREGFAAVYAAELTRDVIFDALRRRRCYATTAERMLLELSVNGCFMGGELLAKPGSSLDITGTAGGTCRITNVELVRDGEVLDSLAGTSQIEHFTFADKADADEHYYYVRVTQADGEKAWSSPVWVVPEQGEK